MAHWSRWAAVVLTLVGVSLVTFAIPRLIPGDPVAVLSAERTLPAAEQAQLRRDLGLDQPLIVQYGRYLAHLARGDLGTSFISKRPVREEFAQRFPATIELALLAMLVGTLLGLLGGYLAAWRAGGVIDSVLSGVALSLYSTPVFLIGLGLVLLISVQWGLTPVSGRIGLAYHVPPVTGFLLLDAALESADAFRSAARHLVLPVSTLATVPFAVVLRMTRGAMLGELGQEYVRVARAKGASRPRAVAHAWRAALVPVIAAAGVAANQLFSGAVLTETVFGWPGIGLWLVEATQRRDYAVLQAVLLLVAGLVIAIGLLADLLQRTVDPRLGRHGP